MDDRLFLETKKVDWRWFVVSFCFFVLFHLLPSALATSLRHLFSSDSWLSFATWGMIGIVGISGYIGFRSGGSAIAEPSIAAAFYIILVRFIVSRPSEFATLPEQIGRWIITPTLAVAIACVGALIGAWFYRRREKNNAADLPA